MEILVVGPLEGVGEVGDAVERGRLLSAGGEEQAYEEEEEDHEDGSVDEGLAAVAGRVGGVTADVVDEIERCLGAGEEQHGEAQHEVLPVEDGLEAVGGCPLRDDG